MSGVPRVYRQQGRECEAVTLVLGAPAARDRRVHLGGRWAYFKRCIRGYVEPANNVSLCQRDFDEETHRLGTRRKVGMPSTPIVDFRELGIVKSNADELPWPRGLRAPYCFLVNTN